MYQLCHYFEKWHSTTVNGFCIDTQCQTQCIIRKIKNFLNAPLKCTCTQAHTEYHIHLFTPRPHFQPLHSICLSVFGHRNDSITICIYINTKHHFGCIFPLVGSACVFTSLFIFFFFFSCPGVFAHLRIDLSHSPSVCDRIAKRNEMCEL